MPDKSDVLVFSNKKSQSYYNRRRRKTTNILLVYQDGPSELNLGVWIDYQNCCRFNQLSFLFLTITTTHC